MSQTYEIRLSGTGGQGLILAGIILAESAVLDNKNAVQSQSYGPEARGGASKSEVIISDSDIYYPKVSSPDIFLALSQEAFNKYIDDVKDSCIVIADSSIDTEGRSDKRIISIPLINTAEDKLCKPMVANIVSLGAITALTKIVSRDSLEKAVLTRVPKGTEELNRRAITEGYGLVEAVKCM